MRVIAANDNVFVIRESSDTEEGGLIIPDEAQKPTNKGAIISVGKLVRDKGIQEKRIAVFNKHAGFAISVDGVEFHVLKENYIIGLI
jgi:co-chaperonin GroES (HSP10)